MRASAAAASAALAILLLVVPAPARGEPRFAVRQGVGCATCHVNRTGGGMRTPYGVSFAQTGLSTFRSQGIFDPRLGASVAVGANFRLANRTTFATTTSLGGKERSTEAGNTFQIGEGNLYLRLDAIPGRLLLYLDETVAPEGASSREAFVLLHGLPLGAYVKAGRFMLPFGLRIPDDAAFIRQETGFTYAAQDLGVEVGISSHPVSFSLAISNGSQGASDANLIKQMTAQLEVVGPWIRGGLSFSWNDTSTEDFPFTSLTSGAHVGLRLGRLLLLHELDWIRGINDAETYDQIALYNEADFEAVKGLYLRFVFEAFDPLLSLDENERDRFVMGLSWFPLQLLELRLEYRLNRDIPQRPESNADILLFEIHGFL